MAVGLGGEQLWLSPTVANNVNPFDDQSGQGNNGTGQGGISTVSDSASGGSYAYDFDGVGDYITNTTLDLRNLPAMSWSAWVKDDKTSGLSSFFSHGESGVFTNDTYFYQTSGNNNFQVNQSADGSGFAGKPTVSTWNHIACIFDGSGATDADRMRYFVNGAEVSLTYNYTVPALTGNPASSSTMVGNYVSAPTNFMKGLQDDIRVFTRVLTQSEISWLATGRGVLGAPPEGLGDEQLWVSPTLTLDDVSDISGNGNTALIDGTVPVVEDTTGFESFQTDNTTLGTDYVYFNAPSASDIPSASLAFWASSNFTTSYGPVGGFCTSGFNDLRFFIGRKALENVVRLYAKQASGAVTNTDISMPAGKSLTDSVMRHWAITCSGGIVFLYLDGVLIGQTATAFTSDLDIGGINLSLGSQDGRTTSGSAAKYDDIRFYDHAITQAEITHLATSRGVLGPPGQATHYNPFKSHAFINDFQQRLK